MAPLGLSSHRLALELHAPATRISEIVNECRAITADTALRLGRFFDMSPEFWMRLQAQFDLESAGDALVDQIRQEVRPGKHLEHVGSQREVRSS